MHEISSVIFYIQFSLIALGGDLNVPQIDPVNKNAQNEYYHAHGYATSNTQVI